MDQRKKSKGKKRQILWAEVGEKKAKWTRAGERDEREERRCWESQARIQKYPARSTAPDSCLHCRLAVPGRYFEV